jgi:uncharacterized membrane protein
MSTLIELYIIFAISTAITSCYFFFAPRLFAAKYDGVKNDLVNNPKLSCLIYTLVGCIIAPILFFILVMPGAGDNYMDGLDTILRDENS